MTFFSYPFQIDSTGRTATVGDERHVRQLIEQLLFTIPGERVNRPTFGTAVNNLVFNPNTADLVATVRRLIQSSLQAWLGEEIVVENLEVRSEDATMTVTVQYVLRKTQQRYVVEINRGVTA